INSVIYDNVQRMKCDKNASLALLDYQQGMLKLSGLHEEMIVVRCNIMSGRFPPLRFARNQVGGVNLPISANN
ncbi:MAG: hypothetical protein WCF82_20885, partial [Microcoleus sp.]